MAKLQAPSGFRDFLPAQQRRRAELMRRIRETYESFGFEPMETPVMENISVFLGKGGGENEKLMFRVLKRGEALQRAQEKGEELADMGLRFDLTVPLARYYATHRAQLPSVFKRYQIGPVWRAERAQHGRFREFIQCDVDVLGSSSMMVEAEVIVASVTALERLGFQGLAVRLNSRWLLRDLILAAGISEELVGGAITTIDKADKITADEVRVELLGRGVTAESAALLLDLRERLQGLDNLATLERAEAFLGIERGLRNSEEIRKVTEPLREILDLVPTLPAGAALILDPFLARGMDYYTGPIFEIAAEGVPFSLAGGGRFDELIGKLSGQAVPACGFSIGFERVFTLMEERGMFGKALRAADVLVTVPARDLARAALDLAADLRRQGLSVDVHPGVAKLPAQFELAEKKGIGLALVLKAEELADGKVTVRELATRQNVTVARDDLVTWIRDHLHGA